MNMVPHESNNDTFTVMSLKFCEIEFGVKMHHYLAKTKRPHAPSLHTIIVEIYFIVKNRKQLIIFIKNFFFVN